MGPLAKMDRLERILSNMDKALEDHGELMMESTEVDHMMVDFNILQMDAGKDSNDKDIVPEYTERTVAIKKKKGQVYSRVTLEDTREFKGGMKVRSYRNKAEILSEDSKSGMLQEKYGDTIFGLNDKHMAMLRSFLKPHFQIFLRKYINQ